MAKLNLAVIFGGKACEHDVSIVTALQCMDAVDATKYDVLPVYIARDGAWYTGEALRKMETLRSFKPEEKGILRVYPDVTSGSGALLSIERQKRLFFGSDKLVVAARIDVALLALHGTNGEDGAVQGLLELMNVPYTSSGLVGSAVGMDKIAMRQLFRGCGFPVLDDLWFTRDAWARDAEAEMDRVEAKLAYPVFVKPANLGSSIGISCARDRQSLRDAVEVAIAYDRRIIVETGVEKPVEVNCSVLGFGEDIRTSVCEMPVSWESFLTFDEKYLRGGKGKTSSKSEGMASLNRRIPAPIGDEMTARVKALSAEVFRALDCKGVVRIDFMIDGETLYVGEINTIPGSLAFYLWEPEGLPYAKLIDEMVALAQKAQDEKNSSVFAFDSELLQKITNNPGGSKR